MGLIDWGAVCTDSTKIKANANRRDIGTEEQLQRRYDHIEEACQKRYRQWQEATEEEEKVFLQKKIDRAQKKTERARSRHGIFQRSIPNAKEYLLPIPTPTGKRATPTISSWDSTLTWRWTPKRI